MFKKILSTSLFIFLFTALNNYPQHEAQLNETESVVPELEQFHEIIYPIWHTAYPAKDFAALKSYAAEADSFAAKIYAAKLPGILRDKKVKWDKGVADFKKSIEEFSLQSGGNNNEALLSAAEELHSKYEMLVRIIRPVSKEVDDFHKLLYVVYHTYLPGKEFSEIISVSGELLKKSEAIAQMKPSKRMESKSEKINSASNELLSAVKDLNSIKDISNENEISLAVEKVHGKYQKLEEIF